MACHTSQKTAHNAAYTDKRIAESVQKACKYLKMRGAKFDFTLIPITQYLEKKYAISTGLPYDSLLMGNWQAEMHPLEGLISPKKYKYDAQTAKTFSAELPRLMYLSLYCKNCGLDSNYWAMMHRQSADSMGYGLPHAALSLKWLQEKKCEYADSIFEKVKKQQLFSLKNLVTRQNCATDLGIEAVSMLGYLGGKEAIQAEWIEKLLSLQDKNGAWKTDAYIYTPTQEITHNTNQQYDHTTVLALWVLLMYGREGEGGVNMVE